jgi:hypothetical protein
MALNFKNYVAHFSYTETIQNRVLEFKETGTTCR